MSSTTDHKTGRKGKKSFPKKPKTKKVAPRGTANLFGYHAVEAAWRNKRRKINTVFATDAAWQSFSERVRDVSLDRPFPKIITRQEMDKILPNQVHQGIAVDAESLPETCLQDIIIQEKDKNASLLLMLDQVTDPHNVGAILRSACAFGVSAMIQQRRHAPMPEGVLAKTASGAVEHVTLVEEVNLSEALEELQRAGYKTIALDERGENINKIFATPPKKAVLVLGAEGKGLRPKIKETCDFLVKLPTDGPISSLNVSNAAAVSLYALTRLN